MCDRTQDLNRLLQEASGGKFSAFAQKNRNSNFSDPSSNSSKSKSGNNSSSGAFNDAASEIARGMHRTSAMLQKLTTLVRQQGLFDDPTDEINSLVHRIKQDLDELNGKCDSAQTVIDSQRSVFTLNALSAVLGAPESTDSRPQSTQHNSKVVSQLKSDLLSTTKDFKTVLELRSSKMRDQQVRRVELTGKGMLSPLRAANSEASKTSTSEPNNSSEITRRSSRKTLPTPYGNVSSEEENSFYNAPQQQHQFQQQLLLEPISGSQQYYESREQAVTEVEKTIQELGGLFKRLAGMISEQRELVDRIDTDIENAVETTNSSREVLQKAFEKASSNSGMYFKIFGILALFILFFVLFVL